jgi:hypothetical protein
VRIVLGVAGGIAAYKACSLLRLMTEGGHDVTVVPTAAALRFVGAPTWEALSGKRVHTDVWSEITAVPHVRIGQDADLVVVAPATADVRVVVDAPAHTSRPLNPNETRSLCPVPRLLPSASPTRRSTTS